MEEGVGDLKYKVPTLLVLNKKDLIKPGEIAKKLEVRYLLMLRSFIALGVAKTHYYSSQTKYKQFESTYAILCRIHQLHGSGYYHWN